MKRSVGRVSVFILGSFVSCSGSGNGGGSGGSAGAAAGSGFGATGAIAGSAGYGGGAGYAGSAGTAGSSGNTLVGEKIWESKCAGCSMSIAPGRSVDRMLWHEHEKDVGFHMYSWAPTEGAVEYFLNTNTGYLVSVDFSATHIIFNSEPKIGSATIYLFNGALPLKNIGAPALGSLGVALGDKLAMWSDRDETITPKRAVRVYEFASGTFVDDGNVNGTLISPYHTFGSENAVIGSMFGKQQHVIFRSGDSDFSTYAGPGLTQTQKPDYEGDRVVYEGVDGTERVIHLLDAATGSHQIIGRNAADHHAPRINEGHVVWAAVATNGDVEYQVWDGATNHAITSMAYGGGCWGYANGAAWVFAGGKLTRWQNGQTTEYTVDPVSADCTIGDNYLMWTRLGTDVVNRAFALKLP